MHAHTHAHTARARARARAEPHGTHTHQHEHTCPCQRLEGVGVKGCLVRMATCYMHVPAPRTDGEYPDIADDRSGGVGTAVYQDGALRLPHSQRVPFEGVRRSALQTNLLNSGAAAWAMGPIVG